MPWQTKPQSETEPTPTDNLEGVLGNLNLQPTQATVTGHAWRQRGTKLYCTSCPARHESTLPVGVRLVGFDEAGLPRFERRGQPVG